MKTLLTLAAWALSALALPLPALAQDAYLGAVGGRTTTNLMDGGQHHGPMAGIFLQVGLTEHFGFRTEANWVRMGLGDYSPLYSIPPGGGFITNDLDYLEMNASGQMSFRSERLALVGSWVGVAVFAGGWIGSHRSGGVLGTEPESYDFGPLVGLGLSWGFDRFLLQVDARTSNGRVRYWKMGPKRDGSHLVFSLGYGVR